MEQYTLNVKGVVTGYEENFDWRRRALMQYGTSAAHAAQPLLTVTEREVCSARVADVH